MWVRTLRHFSDARGWFAETYSQASLSEVLGSIVFVQDNMSYSRQAGVIRGLHFQIPPAAQDKLVNVIRGAVFDVVVDLRRRSATYGQSAAIELSAANRKQLFIPKGFAHGYLTLEPETEVFYKVSAPYSPQHDRGIKWNDPDLGVDWPVHADDVVLSDKDQSLPGLADLPTYFE